MFLEKLYYPRFNWNFLSLSPGQDLVWGVSVVSLSRKVGKSFPTFEMCHEALVRWIEFGQS